MTALRDEPMSDATRLRQRGLRVTGPRLAILATLEQVGGHRAVDELVLALRRAGYHHARTTVYNALDDLARAGLVRPAQRRGTGARLDLDPGSLPAGAQLAPQAAGRGEPGVDVAVGGCLGNRPRSAR